MTCPKCGAQISAGNKFCEFCGAQISLEMRKEQEQLNKVGCPRCGSGNVIFEREKQGELKGKKGNAIVRTTVGMCRDCGYTWQATVSAGVKKRKTWLWVLGWIFIFPVPLTILMLRKKEMKPWLKYGIIALAWVVYLLIALTGNGEETAGTDYSNLNAGKTSVVAETSENNAAEISSTKKSVATNPKKEDNLVNGMHKDFKEAMDGYEKFMNEYVSFMKKYMANPSDLSMLTEYANYMSKYAEMCEKFEKWESDDMNNAEAAYYLEVQTRVNKKLLEVAY